MRRILIERGWRSGTLRATGRNEVRFSGKRRETFAEVICDEHSNRFWVTASRLKSKHTAGCRGNPECVILQPGATFGELTVISKPRRKGRRTEIQVRCKHGNKFWPLVYNLKNKNTTTCEQNPECGLKAEEKNHHGYLKKRTPGVDITVLAVLQYEVCVVCGNIRSKKKPRSREHLVPVVWSVRKKTWLLKTKHAFVNSPINIGLSHAFCNQSRSDTPLIEYWKLYPEFEAPAKAAISGLFPAGQIRRKDMSLVREILKQVGALCSQKE
jgi:hypothetical protein